MHRIMLDFETASTERNAAILQFAAVEFGLLHGQQRREFNEYISVASNESFHRHFSPETMKWWDTKDQTIRAKVFSGVQHLSDVLINFHNWVEKTFGDPKEVELWSRGAGFDCEILQQAFYEVHGEYPFDFRNHMCQRTVERLMPQFLLSAVPPNLSKHDALSDAHWQANVMDVALRNLTWFPDSDHYMQVR